MSGVEALLDKPVAAAANAQALQPATKALGKLGALLTRSETWAGVLHGRWLGHPLHPVLVQAPIGFLASAVVADRVDGGERTAGRLLGLSLLSSLPAAAAGAADSSRGNPEHQRVATVHAALNTAGLLLSAVSWRRHARGAGKVSALAALGVVGVSGAIGGHLSFRMASGANRTAGVADRVDGEWHDIGLLSELPEGRPVRRVVGAVAVAVVRHGGEVAALADECSHMSGPLSEGEVRDGCLVCPWHASAFDLVDGSVRGGPAVAPQPVLRTRVREGRVEVGPVARG